ncbi:MAG: hypothetical protein OEU92_10160, partial [Alphaproteobacteria bacterium]|nr:hypothetical protein [Alphaproteobacteria bacterium]
GLTTVTLPPMLGWLLAAACLIGFVAISLRRQSQRRARGLELESGTALWGQIVFFGVLLISAVAMGYYSRGDIRALLGLSPKPVHPDGYDVPPQDLDDIAALTEPVKQRGRCYRVV